MKIVQLTTASGVPIYINTHHLVSIIPFRHHEDERIQSKVILSCGSQEYLFTESPQEIMQKVQQAQSV